MASKAKKPRKVNGYKMAPHIPTGFIVKGLQKDSWKIGNSIGKGGFGEIYSCTKVNDGTSTTTKSKGAASYPYAIKIEPKENGPLFVEMHFYMKVAKKDDVETWMKSKGIKRLGMPHLACSGSFEFASENFRFVVMDRYGKDIWSLFLENNKKFPIATILKLGLQILDVLEYIHDQGYAHCDVKGSNLLLGTQKGTEDQVYLVDFGLATRYNTTEFKPDPKKAHNGTIEYTSRDAHQGVITRRGDMEILGYNLLHWSTSILPWDNITDPKVAEVQKKSLMDKFASSSKNLAAPSVIVKYLDYVSKLKYDQDPDYDYCRKLFKDELKKTGETNTGKLVFSVTDSKSPVKTVRKRAQAVNKGNWTEDEDKSSENSNEPVTPRRSTRQQGAHQPTPTRDVSPDENKPPSSINPRSKTNGPSWKDSATIQASGVVKAGEYVSKNPKPIKRQRKV